MEREHFYVFFESVGKLLASRENHPGPVYMTVEVETTSHPPYGTGSATLILTMAYIDNVVNLVRCRLAAYPAYGGQIGHPEDKDKANRYMEQVYDLAKAYLEEQNIPWKPAAVGLPEDIQKVYGAADFLKFDKEKGFTRKENGGDK